MPRLVRRKPLLQRVSAMLNPMDVLLWLSEELETRDWVSAQLGTQLGLGLNLVLLLARANYGSQAEDSDIFGEDKKSGWKILVVSTLVWSLVPLSVVNAVYALSRNRKYRMFEANIDTQPGTSSARRVHVHSSSTSSSPLRYIANMITPESAESRAHPDKHRDVWELSVWDPLPVSLRLFCFFSPGHALIYLTFLPLAPLDPRPSITVFNTLLMQGVLSFQLLFLCSRFSQQARDNAVIQKEVMHEYDIKFVRPMLHPLVRDAGTQASDELEPNSFDIVELGTPITLIRRNFKTHGNPYVDSPETTSTRNDTLRQQTLSPSIQTRRSDSSLTPLAQFRNTAARRSMPGNQMSTSISAHNLAYGSSGKANAGSQVGLSNQRDSPLKKTISLNDMNHLDHTPSRNFFGVTGNEQRSREQGRSSLNPVDGRQDEKESIRRPTSPYDHSARRRLHQQENYPPRW